MMVDVDTVVNSFSLKPQHFKLDKTDTTKLEEIVEEYILQCEDLIKSYCNNQFTDEVPLAVSNVCLRLVSNMITFVIQRRDSPLIKVNDWTIQTVSSEIFEDSLKEDLKPYVKQTSYTADPIDFFAITGADDLDGQSNNQG